MASLEGKVAIVTGAARGTGAAIARRMVEEGARVLLGDVLHEEGRKVAAELGEAASYLPHDVSDEGQWAAVVERALALYGRVDVLVNNAAILHIGAVERTDAAKLRWPCSSTPSSKD